MPQLDLLKQMHALLHSSKLPKNLWGKAITHAVWLKNRTPTQALSEGKTPFKMMYRRKPELSRLRGWGSKVWVYTTKGTKLDGQAKAGRWMGFDDETNGHRVYWPDKCSINIECSVKFCNGDMIIPPILSAVLT
jgi:hypothetical protein